MENHKHEALDRETLINQLILAATALCARVYRHIPTYAYEGATPIYVHRCEICKRMAVGDGMVNHRLNCAVPKIKLVLRTLRHLEENQTPEENTHATQTQEI